MKKNIFCFVIVILICAVPFFINCVNEHRLEEQDTIKKRESLNYNFNYWLFMQGEFGVEMNDIKMSNVTYNPVAAEMAIFYYNYYNNDEITYEELMDEYDNFRLHNQDYDNLEKYMLYMEQHHYEKTKKENDTYFVSYDVFKDTCNVYLDMDSATVEDVEYVCQKVVDEIEELYIRASIIDIKPVLLDLSIECEIFGAIYQDEELSEIDNKGKIVLEDGAVELELTKSQWIWIDDYEKWLVTGIKIQEPCHESIFGATVGSKREDVEARINTAEEYGYKLKIDTNTNMVFSKDDLINICFEFDSDGLCSEICIKVILNANDK